MIFGDSHAECFQNEHCAKKNIVTHVFSSSSALGLSNPNARKQTGNNILEILEILKTVPKTTKIMFYYGKVDLMGLFLTHLTDENMLGNLRAGQDATRIMPIEATYDKYTARLKAECSKYGIQYCDAPVIDRSKCMPIDPIDHHLHKNVYIEWLPTLCNILRPLGH